MAKVKMFNLGNDRLGNEVWELFLGQNYARITRIKEGGMLASKDKKYRVDVNGKTVATLIGHFQSARKIANERLKALTG